MYFNQTQAKLKKNCTKTGKMSKISLPLLGVMLKLTAISFVLLHFFNLGRNATYCII